MALPGNLGELSLSTLGEAIAFAAGFAAARALEPLGVELAQEAWKIAPLRAVDPGSAAGIVAEDVQRLEWGKGEAEQHGINGERFDAILGETLNGPGMGELLRMLRRGSASPADFAHGLRKAKLEPRWDDPLSDLQHERLDPAVVATSIQRGLLHDPGYLPTVIDFAGADVPPPAVSSLDPVAEAAAAGISSERLALQTRIVGLPPAPGELLQLVNRGQINEAAFRMGIAEGNTRNEWAEKLLTLRRRLLTPHEYAELRLRGWIDDAAMHGGAALSGFEQADTDLLFKLLGRPIPVHQVTTGLARGGRYNGPTADIPEAYVRSLQQGNQRPEWYDLSYANRYSYPSAFVIRTLATTGELSADDVHQTLLEIGWRPDFAEKVTRAWTTGGAAKADPHIGKAETQLWSALHKAYVDDLADDAIARDELTAAGVHPDAQATVLELWKRERTIRRRSLTPKEIKKAVGPGGWTEQEALARLEQLGYSAADAAVFLGE